MMWARARTVEELDLIVLLAATFTFLPLVERCPVSYLPLESIHAGEALEHREQTVEGVSVVDAAKRFVLSRFASLKLPDQFLLPKATEVTAAPDAQ
jgi:hypothetical protein